MEDMDKAQGDLAARLAEVRLEATAAAGGEALLIRNGQLEHELVEQSLQVGLLTIWINEQLQWVPNRERVLK